MNFNTPGQFYRYSDQLNLNYSFARSCPTGHYSRKNIGYILANRLKTEFIYESDDDNFPIEGWANSWPKMKVEAQVVSALNSDWLNIYTLFSQKNIWPRGLPLSKINRAKCKIENKEVRVEFGRISRQ